MAMPTRPRFKAPPHPALDYRPPRSLRLIRAATISFVSLASVVIIYVIWWFALAMSLNTAADDWIAARTAEGWTINTTRREIDGFPFVLRLNIDDPVIARADGLSWSAASMTLHSLPLPGMPVTVRSSGPQSIALPPPPPPPQSDRGFDLPYSPAPKAFTGKAELIEFDVAGLYTLPEAVNARVTGLELKSDDAIATAVQSATLALTFSPNAATDHTTPSATMSLQAEGIQMPRTLNAPLGALLHSVTINATLLGAVPSDKPVKDGLSTWRDNGGTVELNTLEFRYGPMWLKTSGTLALDGDLQPVGAATAKMRGLFDAIEQMRATGLVSAKQAVTATLVLGALARRAPDGGPPVLNLPLSIQERQLTVGPVPLLKLPSINWPGMPEKPVELSTKGAA